MWSFTIFCPFDHQQRQRLIERWHHKLVPLRYCHGVMNFCFHIQPLMHNLCKMSRIYRHGKQNAFMWRRTSFRLTIHVWYFHDLGQSNQYWGDEQLSLEQVQGRNNRSEPMMSSRSEAAAVMNGRLILWTLFLMIFWGPSEKFHSNLEQCCHLWNWE